MTDNWEVTIRELEERGRIAFLAADTATLDGLWAEGLLVNSPLNVINHRARVLELLSTGRIKHELNEVVIEQIARYGNVVVVMGRDVVDGPPTFKRTERRFT